MKMKTESNEHTQQSDPYNFQEKIDQAKKFTQNNSGVYIKNGPQNIISKIFTQKKLEQSPPQKEQFIKKTVINTPQQQCQNNSYNYKSPQIFPKHLPHLDKIKNSPQLTSNCSVDEGIHHQSNRQLRGFCLDQDYIYSGKFINQIGNLQPYEIITSMKSKAGEKSPNVQKVNQDSCEILVQQLNDTLVAFYGVFDGHGEYGEQVSNFVKINLSKTIIQQIKKLGERAFNQMKQILIQSHNQTCNELISNSKIDTFLSGTTSISILIINNTIFCSNVGDSRAMVVKQLTVKGQKNTWQAQFLSEDHKPDVQKEKKRIINYGGIIEKQDDIGIYRIWNKNMEYPGLAMTRSIGDKAGREIGLISEPDIIDLQINEEIKFIIIASDGIWEFLNDNDVMNIVIPFYKNYDCEGAANSLIKQARSKWKMNDGNTIDDITCIILFIKA